MKLILKIDIENKNLLFINETKYFGQSNNIDKFQFF